MDTSENNYASITGEVVPEITLSHQIREKKFFKTALKVPRLSGQVDLVPLIVPDTLVSELENCQGPVIVTGQFRSQNLWDEKSEKTRLILFVFVQDMFPAGEAPGGTENNQVFLDGYLCKPPVYRKTPLGREVTDLILAVNRLYGKSDYIPCIVWGRNARLTAGLEIGTHLRLSGRVQSREYRKMLDEERVEVRTAYELSATCVEIVEEKTEAEAQA